MSKISDYLNEHLLGEVSASENIKRNFSQDESILQIAPEMVVFPKVTNDVRKVARFAWQLAEKNRKASLTARGEGYGVSGAAIGKGIVVDVSTYLNKVLYISPKGKDRFVHVQAGASMNALESTLASHGLTVHSHPDTRSTVGGAIADNGPSPYDGRYGYIGDRVKKVEVVLASGDIIETGRLSKRETSQKKALPTLEGEIYRGLDQIIDDNQDLINGLPDIQMAGYNGIKYVRAKDGSMDLTPLLVSSQGTLGIITEAVLDVDFITIEDAVAVMAFPTKEAAYDALEAIYQFAPARLEYLDGDLFKTAKLQGKDYGLFDIQNTEAVVYASFDDSSERSKQKKLKKLMKMMEKHFAEVTLSTSIDHTLDTLRAIADIWSVLSLPTGKTETNPDLLSGSILPVEGREEFIKELQNIGNKLSINLPISVDWLSGRANILTSLKLSVVSDRQKAFKLIKEYTELILSQGGIIRPEGRLGAPAYYSQLDQQTIDLYTQIKAVFDPLSTMNDGVKVPTEIRSLAAIVNPHFTGNPYR